MNNANNATLFKQAHAMTKQVIKQGDCYRTTFGLCLKVIKEKNTQVKVDNFFMISVILFLFTLLPLAILTNIVILPVIAIALSLSFIAIYLTKFNTINKGVKHNVL